MSSNEEQEDRGFKVRDRRRFSDNGEARQEGDAESEKSTTTSQQSEPTNQPSPEDAQPIQEAASDASHSHDNAHTASLEMSFATFILSLSTQALAALGEIPDPSAGGNVQSDLGAARQLIDILSILQEKTRGNLDNDESALLEHALYDLRMKFVEQTQKSHQPS